MLLAGCGVLAEKRRVESAPLPAPSGTVVLVDEARRFALVDFGTLPPPMPGTAVKCFSGGSETGILAVGPQRRGVFLVADIVSGAPGVGDRVYR
jgi:hypothetical protein